MTLNGATAVIILRFSSNSVALGADYVEVVEDRPMAIFVEVTESVGLIGTCAIYIHFSIMTRLKVSLYALDLIEIGLSAYMALISVKTLTSVLCSSRNGVFAIAKLLV